jgi:type IV pilus assembly protein PilV
MSKQKLYSKKTYQNGSVLLEALIAVLIFSLGILALVGLQANMLKNTGTSKFRTDASYIAQKKIGEMWADPGNLTTYVQSNIDISTDIPGGRFTVTQLNPGQFQVTVGWTAPGETPAANVTTGPCFMQVAHCFTTVANIMGG